MSYNDCVCIFMKLHIAAQSGPVILVIIFHLHWSCLCVRVSVELGGSKSKTDRTCRDEQQTPLDTLVGDRRQAYY